MVTQGVRLRMCHHNNSLNRQYRPRIRLSPEQSGWCPDQYESRTLLAVWRLPLSTKALYVHSETERGLEFFHSGRSREGAGVPFSWSKDLRVNRRRSRCAGKRPRSLRIPAPDHQPAVRGGKYPQAGISPSDKGNPAGLGGLSSVADAEGNTRLISPGGGG